MLRDRFIIAIMVLLKVKANNTLQDCSTACGSAANSLNMTGDLTSLISGGSNCMNTPMAPLTSNGLINTSVVQPCYVSQNQYSQPPTYVTTPPQTNISNNPPPQSDNSKSECYLTTSIDCTTPDQTTPNFAPAKSYEQSSPPNQSTPNQPSGNQECSCDNSSNQVNNSPPQSGSYNGNQCFCPSQNTYNAPPAPQRRGSPLVVANFTTPGGNQQCDCTNTNGGNNFTPQNSNGNNQICDCGVPSQQPETPMNQRTYSPPSVGISRQQVPCIQPNIGSGTFQNLTGRQSSIFNLNECYQAKPITRGPTAIIGKTEMPISDNVTFATDSCSLANSNAGC